MLDTLLSLLPVLCLWLASCPLGFLSATGAKCCCCEYFTDSFDRADDTNIGSDWTETTGNWSIASNLLTVSSTSAVCICNTAHPDFLASMHVRVSIRGSTDGDIIRVYIAYFNASNYHYAEFKIGPSGYIKLFNTASGQLAITTTGTYITANVLTPVHLCIDLPSGNFQASVDDTYCAASTGSSFSGFGSTPAWKAGVGTGGTLAGAAYFDDFSITKASVACGNCANCCRAANPSCCVSFPTQMDVTIPDDYVNNACTSCASIGGHTFTLTNKTTTPLVCADAGWTSGVSPGDGSEVWYYTSTMCGEWDLRIVARLVCVSGKGQCQMNVTVALVRVGFIGPPSECRFYQSAVETIQQDCTTKVWTCPFVSGSGTTQCTFSGTNDVTIQKH